MSVSPILPGSIADLKAQPAAHAAAVVLPLPLGRASPISGELICPPDKSVTHRSIIFAAMASGQSRIVSPLLGADCRSTIAVFRALGVQLELAAAAAGATNTQAELIVESKGWDQWQSPLVPLDFGNSGTTARLLTGVFAATPGLFATCFGDSSLSKRPMGRIVTPLRQIGAQIQGRASGTLLPMAIAGQTLRPADHVIDKATAQVKSALLLAGLNISGRTNVRLPSGSRDHTERMLQSLGADVKVMHRDGFEDVSVHGPFRPMGRIYRVPGDPSSAAFFAVLAAITQGELKIHGVLDNKTRTGFIKVLSDMGAKIDQQPVDSSRELFLEPIMNLVITGGHALRAVGTDPLQVATFIDEVPVLAVAALFAAGTSRFAGLGELRVKESDRLEKIRQLLTLAGGEAWIEGDDLVIKGHGGTDKQVHGFHFDPDQDHRLAMAAAILAKAATSPSHIKDPDCVDVSFPRFFTVLGTIG